MENTVPKQIQYPHIVGVDISKMSIDVAMINSTSMKCNAAQFSNDSDGFQKMVACRPNSIKSPGVVDFSFNK